MRIHDVYKYTILYVCVYSSFYERVALEIQNITLVNKQPISIQSSAAEKRFWIIHCF